jgi:hypothetical protein
MGYIIVTDFSCYVNLPSSHVLYSADIVDKNDHCVVGYSTTTGEVGVFRIPYVIKDKYWLC